MVFFLLPPAHTQERLSNLRPSNGGIVLWRTLWYLWYLEDEIVDFFPSNHCPRHESTLIFLWSVDTLSEIHSYITFSLMLPFHKEMETHSGRWWSVMMTHGLPAQSLLRRRCSIIICAVNGIIIVLTYNVFLCSGAEHSFVK